MKVLHVLNDLMPSGAEVMLKLAAKYWVDKGVQLYILSVGKKSAPFVNELKNAGFTIDFIEFSNSLYFLRKFFAYISNNNYNVVHIHTERGFLRYALLCRIAKVGKILRTVHNVFDFKGKTRLSRIVQRRIGRALGLEFISIGPAVYNNELKILNNRTSIIQNWYDDLRFVPPSDEQRYQARRELEIPHDNLAVVTVGNCSAIKNHDLILKSLKSLPTKIIYLHAGKENDDQCERRSAESLGIADQVRFLGQTEKIEKILWAADLYVMPSQNEGFSIAALEALATGVPCLFSDCPGLLDMSGLSDNIKYFDRNSEDISSMIENYLKIAVRSHKNRITEQFGIEKGAAAYLKVYKGIE